MRNKNKVSFEIGYVFKTKRFKRNPKLENSLERRAYFELVSILGYGSFGRVNKVKHCQTDKK